MEAIVRSCNMQMVLVIPQHAILTSLQADPALET